MDYNWIKVFSHYLVDLDIVAFFDELELAKIKQTIKNSRTTRQYEKI